MPRLMKIRRSGAYLEKDTLNLASHSQRTARLSRTALLVAAAVVLAALFIKFGIADPLIQHSRAVSRRDDAAAELAAIEAANSDYADVLAEYQLYSHAILSDEENSTVDRSDILELLNMKLIPRASVQSVSVSGNSVTVQLSGIRSNDLPALIDSLAASPIVSEAELSSVDASDVEGTTAVITILCSRPAEAE